MRIVLTSRGSRGDVYPIIEIAASLVRSGHSVVMAAPTFFAHRLRDRRVPHRCYSEDTLAVMRGFGSGWGAAKTALDWFSSSVDEQFAVMLEETRNADVLVTSANEIAAPTVAEYRRMPHFRVAYTPLLPGTQPPPLVPWQGLPPEGNRLMWRVLNIGTGLFIRRYIDRWRRRLSLPRMGPVRDYFTGNSHTLLAIHPTLAPPCPTWSGRYRFTYCGHCDGAADGHESSGADEGLDPDLERFLAAEPPPIYVGFGSVHVKHPRRITRMILEATRRSGCRVVIGSGWSGLGQFRPGAHGHRGEVNGPVFVAGETPHSILFERTAGVAHHGGSGTTHTAAAAGVPQFIMPQFADQYYWGRRIHSLGLGPPPVGPDRLTVKILIRSFETLARSHRFGQRARCVAEHVRNLRGVEEAVRRIIGAGAKD